jgi:ATP-dependent helicase HrpA
LFIHHALVEGELLPEEEGDPKFLSHNKLLVRQVRDMENKGRSQDILADNDSVFAFYDSRVPQEMYCTAQFEKWRKEAERKNPNVLFMTTDHIMKRTASEINEKSFPDALTLGGATLNVNYRFAPGEEDDGLTLKVPLEALGSVDEAKIEWLVPGRLEEKITVLLRTLPKAIRKDIEPLGPLAAAAAKELPYGQGHLPEVLARYIHQKLRVRVSREDFRLGEVPSHLKMNLIVLGEDGKELARGRDAAELRERLADKVKAAFAKLAKAGFDRDGIRTWDLGVLPKQTTFERAGSTIVGYPALLDMGTSVSLRLLESEKAAELAHRTGLRRLFLMHAKDDIVHKSRLIATMAKMTMQFAEFGKPEELKADIQLLIADRAFIGDGNLMREEADFQVSLKIGRKNLEKAASEVSKVVGDILQARHNVALAIGAKPPPAWVQAMADVKVQLEHLTPRGFLLATPWERLRHMARYLNGIHYRIHKLGLTGVQRDQKWMWEVLPHWQRYVQKIATTKDPVVLANLLEYRWMVEEFRVSLFAQELGTSMQISAKRLDEQWAKVTM